MRRWEQRGFCSNGWWAWKQGQGNVWWVLPRDKWKVSVRQGFEGTRRRRKRLRGIKFKHKIKQSSNSLLEWFLLKQKRKGFVMKKSYLHKKINCVQCFASLSLRLNRNKYLSHIYRTVGWRRALRDICFLIHDTNPWKCVSSPYTS